MSADLVPNEAIPKLAAEIDSPAMLRVLRYLHKTGFILNGDDIDQNTFAILQRLTDLHLVDPGYNGQANGRPYLWASNGNGSRVLKYLDTAPLPAGALESKLKIHSRALSSLASLSDWDQLKLLCAAETLSARPPASWDNEDVVRLNEEKSVFLLRVSPDLRAFIRILDSGDIELFDIVREETLKLFLERQRAAGAHS